MKARLAKATLVIGLLLLWGGVGSAFAGSFTFNFSGLANGALNSQIQTYMNSVLTGGASVTVTGAVGDNKYNGDGHVVGPCSPVTTPACKSTTTVTSATLRNDSNYPSDAGTFIMNNNGANGVTGNGPVSNEIKMVFANTTITSISFDFEIFPDGTCPVLNSANCGAYNSTTHLYANQPDLKLLANGANVQTWYGITPTTSGTPNTTWVHSPNSGPTNNELAPQLIASSGTITLGSGINTLEFVDWPATIGIQNVVITTPEPSSVILLGMGLLGGLGAMKRKMLG